MSTTSSKHKMRPVGDPPMSVVVGNSLLDDMEIIRRLCLPDKAGPTPQTSSHLFFGSETGPVKSCHQLDYGRHPLADTASKATRDARSSYMNNPHFKLGYDRLPINSENREAYKAPPRNKVMQPNVSAAARAMKNASSLRPSAHDRDQWADDLETTHRCDYLHPGVGDVRLDAKSQKADHRATHYVLGTDPPTLKSTNNAELPPHDDFVRQKPVKAAPSAVQLGSSDYPWHKALKSTHQQDYVRPPPDDGDALATFMRKACPFSLGDDARELMTEHRGAYKKIEYLDCSNLTDEQLAMLGVTREQIIPRKVPLPFLGSARFHNAMGQTFGGE